MKNDILHNNHNIKAMSKMIFDDIVPDALDVVPDALAIVPDALAIASDALAIAPDALDMV